MSENEQIRALAELDGFEPNGLHKSYLTSYDAIIPLIQKQDHSIKVDVFERFAGDYGWSKQAVALLMATPAQLCEALLRACGKWKE